VLKYDVLKDKRTISPVEAILEAWRRTISRLGLASCFPPYNEKNVEQLYLRAHANARIGKLEMSAQQFAAVSRMSPSFGDAFQGHAEVLDRMGRFELASRNYDIARRLRQKVRSGPPDRCSVLRHRRTFASDIAAYTAVLRSGPSKRRALTYLARGNAYLASGRAKLALIDYGFVLRLAPKPEVVALRAEALTMLGRYEEALSAFDAAITARPRDAEMYGGRAIAQLALGRLGHADDDWRQQLELLPLERTAARACVLLRLGDHAAALPEVRRAMEKEPSDPYWRLYHFTVMRLLDHTACYRDLEAVGGECWPGPLLALHAGRLSVDETLKQADNAERRAEAMFQIGVACHERDPEEARRWWARVIEATVPSAIEHAAARHQLVHFGA
jgi:tetratricopeptide (TPR) repeat protein